MNHSHHLTISEHTVHSSSLFIWFNTFEIGLIVLFIALFIFKKDLWQQHKLALSGISALFFVSMLPFVDSLARHSVWLHCLQSSLVHHLIPFLLIAVLHPFTKSRFGTPAPQRTQVMFFISLVSFHLMSVMWLLPSLHLALMENGVLYSAMKWAMAITGLMLCQTMLDFQRYTSIAKINYQQFSVLMLIPQLIIGLTLMIAPPLYVMPESMMHHTASLLPHLSQQADQVLGGVILILASLLFMGLDLYRRQSSLNLYHKRGITV